MGASGKVKGVPVFGDGYEAESDTVRAEDVALIDSGVLNDKRMFWAMACRRQWSTTRPTAPT